MAVLTVLSGCQKSIPIYVWRSAKINADHVNIIALAPLVGLPEVAQAYQAALMAQRPAVRAHVAMLTAEQLAEASPVRLASTAQLSNDLLALQAAKRADADLVMCSRVIDYKLDDLNSQSVNQAAAPQNFNQVFFQRLSQQNQSNQDHYLKISCQLLEVPSGKVLGTHEFKIHSREIAQRYPDLQMLAVRPAEQLLVASARESWKSIAPSVEKSEVRVAAPLFQPGAFRVRWGVRAAKRGQWSIAEQHWQSAADSWLPSPAAHHNLAIAKAAREDFEAAKQELQKATGPLSLRLPPETLLWLDENHRQFCRALQLPPPANGWSFQQPQSLTAENYSVHTVDESKLPWYLLYP